MAKKNNVPQETLQALGRVFRNRRQDMKMNFNHLENKSGVSSLTISKLEKGELENSSIVTLVKIAKVLKLEINLTATPIKGT